jgi:signal transduction histidine kinase
MSEPGTATPRARGDVLIVDDSPANLLAMEGALALLGSRVVRAESGQQALRLLLAADFKVTVIVLDVRMPGLGGIETARLIRANERARHIPIIFVTGYDRDSEQTAAAYQLGAVDLLFKPVVPEVLRSKVNVFLELERRAGELTAQSERLREHEAREHALRLEEERRRWEEESLRARMATLTEIDRRKDEFLAMLGHELRNPLASIVLDLELLRRQEGVPDGGESPRGRVERQVQHLARLVDDLLDVSRINTGVIELRKEPVALAEVIDSAVAMCRPLLQERAHRLVLEAPPTPLTMLADPVRLTQVVTNLVNNAAESTPSGGTIRVAHRRRDDEQVEIVVTDTGAGISPELVPRIFETFVQGERRAAGGMGLGLAVVRRIVEMHGGSVSARSQGQGCGSEFTVTLPAPVDHLRATSSGARGQEAPTGGRQFTIALVEDSDDVREATSELLTMLGHRVESAPDGEAGIELILRLRPDVALVDMALPGMSGCDVAQTVRARSGRPDLRLVAMTGFGLDADRRRARAAGFDDYLVKPADLDALVRALAGTAGPG